MNKFNIGNYLNPHLSLVYTDYYDRKIELYIIDMIYHFLNNDELSKINKLKRVNEIYNLFKKFDFNFINKYKDVHLSGLIAERNNITSFCNIKEFIKPYKSFIEKKFKNK